LKHLFLGESGDPESEHILALAAEKFPRIDILVNKTGVTQGAGKIEGNNWESFRTSGVNE
jgi:hypothetical protein